MLSEEITSFHRLYRCEDRRAAEITNGEEKMKRKVRYSSSVCQRIQAEQHQHDRKFLCRRRFLPFSPSDEDTCLQKRTPIHYSLYVERTCGWIKISTRFLFRSNRLVENRRSRKFCLSLTSKASMPIIHLTLRFASFCDENKFRLEKATSEANKTSLFSWNPLRENEKNELGRK